MNNYLFEMIRKIIFAIFFWIYTSSRNKIQVSKDLAEEMLSIRHYIYVFISDPVWKCRMKLIPSPPPNRELWSL